MRQDDENSDEVQRELKRERGQVVVENVQKEYEVDVVKLEKKVKVTGWLVNGRPAVQIGHISGTEWGVNLALHRSIPACLRCSVSRYVSRQSPGRFWPFQP